MTLAESLKNHFVLVNLGASLDKDYNVPEAICKSFTVLEVDAATQSRTTKHSYFQRDAITGVVAGVKGRRILRINHNPLTSSILPPDNDLIAQYGIEADYVQTALHEVDCITLPDALKAKGIAAVDLLKTDIEGLDYEVLQSMDAFLPHMLAIQCELRFQPFYKGEPFFHEVIAFLNDKGFDLIGMDVEYWQPRTTHRRKHIDGRIVNCDAVLFKRPEAIRAFPADQRPLMWAKQIVLACLLGNKCHAEYILESCETELPPDWIGDLKRMVKPRWCTFASRTFMMWIRFILRFSVRRNSHEHIVKGCRDEFYLGGSRGVW